MKKKVTDEEVGKFLGEVADTVRRQMDFDFRVAQSQMAIAENDLVNTLSKEQRELYDDFCKKREAFYSVASEIYKRKF